MVWLVLAAAIILFAGAVTVIVFLVGSIRNEVPYVMLPEDTMAAVAEALNPAPGAVVYDLGCGDGRLLREISRRFPAIKCIGIENNPVIVPLARLFASRFPHLTIRRGDIFKTDLTSADGVVMFLGPHAVDRLLPQLEQQLRAGVRVVSVDFPFSKRKYDKKLSVTHRSAIARTVYVYEF